MVKTLGLHVGINLFAAACFLLLGSLLNDRAPFDGLLAIGSAALGGDALVVLTALLGVLIALVIWAASGPNDNLPWTVPLMSVGPVLCSTFALVELELALAGVVRTAADAPHLVAIVILTSIVVLGSIAISLSLDSSPRVEKALAERTLQESRAQEGRLKERVPILASRICALPAAVISTMIAASVGLGLFIALSPTAFGQVVGAFTLFFIVAVIASGFVTIPLLAGYGSTSRSDRAASYAPWTLLNLFFVLVCAASLPTQEPLVLAAGASYGTATVLALVRPWISVTRWVLLGSAARIVVRKNVAGRQAWAQAYLERLERGALHKAANRVRLVIRSVIG